MLESKSQPFSRRFPWKGMVLATISALLLTWLYLTPPGVLGKADAVGYSVCHRIDLRSFHIDARQFPVCARCTGQFLGALLALGYQSVLARRRTGRPPWYVITALAVFFLAYAIDGLNSYLHLGPMLKMFPGLPRLYEPSNTLRLLTGTGIGLLIGVALFPAFNSTVWRSVDPKPAIGSPASFAGLVILGLALDGLLLMEIPWIMYPMAILSALATLTLLTMVYTIVVLILFRRENRVERFTQLVWPITGGFGIALVQIGLIDLGRYLLTGTWQGFYLG